MGVGTKASADYGTAIGGFNTANGMLGSAVGYTNTANGWGSSAFGAESQRYVPPQPPAPPSGPVPRREPGSLRDSILKKPLSSLYRKD